MMISTRSFNITTAIIVVSLAAAGCGSAPSEDPEALEALADLELTPAEAFELTAGCPVHVSRYSSYSSKSLLCVGGVENHARVGYADCPNSVKPIFVRARWDAIGGGDVHSGFQGSDTTFRVQGDTRRGEIRQVIERTIFLNDISSSTNRQTVRLGSDVPWLERERTTGWSGSIKSAWHFTCGKDDMDFIPFIRIR